MFCDECTAKQDPQVRNMKLECVIYPVATNPTTYTHLFDDERQAGRRTCPSVDDPTHHQLARRHAIDTGAARLAHLKPGVLYDVTAGTVRFHAL